jgi:hypothetical protein
VSDARRTYWRHALASNSNAGARNRADFHDRQQRAEWLTHRHYWRSLKPWQDGQLPQ